jgi:hypothetical protein
MPLRRRLHTQAALIVPGNKDGQDEGIRHVSSFALVCGWSVPRVVVERHHCRHIRIRSDRTHGALELRA